MLRIIQHTVADLFKNWIIILFTLFLAGASFGFFALEGQHHKALIGLLNLGLLIIPMISIIFATIYYYNMYEFIVLMLATPLKRRDILGGIYISLAVVFTVTMLAGVGIPLLILYPTAVSALMLGVFIFLALIFTAIALFSGVVTRDKTRGMGVAILLWVYFALLFDGIILLLMYNFADYPIEDFVLFITFLNPLDLSRIIVLMQTEAAALMGYTGALFEKFFTNSAGILAAFGMLLLWVALPLWIAFRMFRKKDL